MEKYKPKLTLHLYVRNKFRPNVKNFFNISRQHQCMYVCLKQSSLLTNLLQKYFKYLLYNFVNVLSVTEIDRFICSQQINSD